ncbi:MAG: hypothetical protein IKC37_04830 [Clostridia bacterium]|nr:hypothetical protein [Clostridia bacterium]
MKDIDILEKRIGYVFLDKQLLQEAMTHSTYANLHGGRDNERLEYLGDAVLQFIVTERQYATTLEDEGTLTKRRQEMVCEEALLDAVEEMGISPWLRYEGSLQNVGKKTLSSLYESVLAAVYLDGGMVAAKDFVQRHPTQEKKPVNYKGELQEFLQSRGLTPPVYRDEERKEGFDSVVDADGKTGRGHAKSKRAAEQLAAKELLGRLKMEKKGRR